VPGWRKGYAVDSIPIYLGSIPGPGLEEFHVFRDRKSFEFFVSASGSPLKHWKKQEFSRTDKRTGENENLKKAKI